MRNLFAASCKAIVFFFFTQNGFAAAQTCPDVFSLNSVLGGKVERLKNFAMPIEVKSIDHSLIQTEGLKMLDRWDLKKNISWLTSSHSFEVNWDSNDKKPVLESVWLGNFKEKLEPQKLPPLWKGFWEKLTTPKELELLEKCTLSSCKIKFNVEELRYIVTGKKNQETPFFDEKTTRVDRYFEILVNRMKQWSEENKVYLYDETDFKTNGMNRLSVPDFLSAFLKNLKTEDIQLSGFGYELFNPDPKNHKPVVSFFSRVCKTNASIKRTGNLFCTDQVLYNNHYFDLWTRHWIFVPTCQQSKTLVFASEQMDIDQLKQNLFNQVLLTPTFRSLVEKILEARLGQSF